ncbi:MAG TPA: GNAT family N-acetyltransferase [Streptosporangiaceae bacterium]|jgi:ribosomal protein S18 acetylase RimI-like enzyme|nr:GNAT family N-acetyltransferase [Streptosporangiaceae bacterium]
MVPELLSADELAAACEDDSVCLWAAQGLTPEWGGRAWAGGRAVVVACPNLSGRDRVVVWGEPEHAARLMADVLPELGPSYRLLGHGDLVAELTGRRAEWQASAPFGWMSTPANRPPGHPAVATDGEGPEPVRWLGSDDMPEVNALLDRAFPDSHARPGVPGVRRWAGIDGQTEGEGQAEGEGETGGTLVAAAADAWSAPAMGFMSGVAVDGESRGRGLGGRVCAFVMADLVARHGRVALMVHGWNDQAIRLYQRLGLVYQPIRAAWAGPARN